MTVLTGRIKKLLCLVGDIAALYLALLFTLSARYGSSWSKLWQEHFLPFTIIYFFSLTVFYIIGLYDLPLARNNLFFFITLSKALIINIVLAILLFYFVPYFGITPKTNLFITFGIFTLFFLLWRQFYNRFIKSPTLLNNVLVLGQNQETKELVQYIKDNPQLGYRIKKIVNPDDVKILYDLIEIIVQEKIQTAIITAQPHEDKNLIRNLYQCIPLKIMVTDLSDFYEMITGKIPLSAIGEIWFLQNLMNDHRTLFETTKRAVDLLTSLILGLITLGLTPLIACLIKMDSPGPIFNRQKKVGRDNRIFEAIKFRTKLIDPAGAIKEKSGAHLAKDKADRVTRVGKWLRRTRLDELPQAWNIFKGEMSLVGPHPERPEFAFSEELTARLPFFQVRHSIVPGLTGWAQIKHPYGDSFDDTLQRLQYDLFYIKNRSFVLDVTIALKTVKTFFSGGGR